MPQSRISYNVNGANVPNLEVLTKHLVKLQPRWLLIMDNVELAWALADKLKNTQVIHRNWALTQGDENVYGRLSPEEWLAARQDEAQHGIWLYTANEAGVNPAWDIALMNLIVSRGFKNVKLVLANPSVGTPDISFWSRPEMKEWFRLLHEHRDQFVLGLHEYFAGIAPSGFVGGYPDGSWSDGRTNLHPNYEDRKNWPTDATTIGMTWHTGRLQVVNQAAKNFGYMAPRIVITEHGADDLADMHGWLMKFPPSYTRGNIRGWKTLQFLWERLLPGRSIQLAYLENIIYLDKALYSRYPNVEGQLLYTWTSNRGQWGDFDLSETTEFLVGLEQYAGYVAPPPIENPPPTPPPTTTITVTKAEIEDVQAILDQVMKKLDALKSR